jgi:hypothetical protein
MGKIEGGEEWRNGTGTELEGEPVTDWIEYGIGIGTWQMGEAGE